MKQHLTLLGLMAVLSQTAPTAVHAANFLYLYMHDSPATHALMGAHGRILDPVETHPDPGPNWLPPGWPGAFWVNELQVSETHGPPGGPSDTVNIVGSLQHILPPHGEGVNPFVYRYNYALNAGALPPGANWTGVRGTTAGHGPHADQFWSWMRYWIVAREGGGHDILAYLWMVIARHTDRALPRQGGPFLRKGAQEPPSTEGRGMGAAMVVVDPSSATADLLIGLGGLSRAEVVAAHIHWNPTEPEGYDLGDGGSWEELGRFGLARFLSQIKLSPLALQSLLGGSATIDIHTTTMPDGEFEAALPPVVWLAIQPRPQGVVRLAWPAHAVGFRVESAHAVNGPWSVLTTSPRLEGHELVCYETNAGSPTFYRLGSSR